MTVLFIITSVVQLIFAVIGLYNIYTISVPVILNIGIWGIMFPHILAHALMIYRKSGGIVGSHCGFTFWIITSLGVIFYGNFFNPNFIGMTFFITILSFITILLVTVLNQIYRINHEKI
jgi:hypothetical protein